MESSNDPVRAWAIGLKHSDPAAATELFNRFYPHLFRYARRLTRDTSAAEDVVQEAFLRLWKMRERIDPDRSITSLLFVMVRNLSYTRARRAPAVVDDPANRPARQADPSENVDARLLADRLRTWIDALPARRREAFHLSRFENLSYAEIASVMDISVRTVENHIRLALQDLRDHIRDSEPNLLKQ